MELMSILLQTQSTGNSMMTLLPLLLVFVIFYFFMIRPQQKKQKEIQKMRENMQVGDKVVTAGGVYGKLKEINNAILTVEIAEGVRIKIDKASVFAANNEAQSTK
ncbi:preprotein translocase subunit YajC [Bacteroidia bacterium]|nr:preprotein translocase subunit YajC [Bacteroidia bacterium]